ncbi:preprotein translocase subunit YajC [Bacteroidales bacterium OttesenSCG-928-C19]|nr:preprotein translocase subunit YajC [Bacteroidales bacterium OttesenSCG-928-C19]
MNLLNILLMAPQQGAEGGGSGMSSIIMLVLIVVVFYFFMIRPQMKRAKEEKKFREGLQKGDHVVTAGGIHGKISQVNETTFVVEIANNVHITVEKSSVLADASNANAKEKK